MQRRDVLKTAGGIAGVGAISGAGLVAFSGGARATAAQDFGSATITSDDGTVEYVAVFGDSRVDWTGFEETATQFTIDIDGRVKGETDWVNLYGSGAVSLDNDDWGNYDEETSDPGTSGYIETGIGLDEDGNHDPTIDWHVVGSDPDGYGLPENSIDPAALEVDGDGDTNTFTVLIRSTYTWYDSGGNEVFSEEFTSTVDVTVENVPAEATASDGDGEDGAVGA